jgi:hypothetical protein
LKEKENRQVVLAIGRLSTLIPCLGGRFVLFHKDSVCWSSLATHKDTKIISDWLTHPETGLWDDGVINQVKGKGLAAINSRLSDPFKVKPPSSGLSPLLFRRRPNKVDANKDRGYQGFLVGPEIDIGGLFNGMHNNTLPSNITSLTSYVIPMKTVYLSNGAHILLVYQIDDTTLVMLSPQIDSIQFTQPSFYTYLSSSIHQLFSPLSKLAHSPRRDRSNWICSSISDYDFYLKSNATKYSITPEVEHAMELVCMDLQDMSQSIIVTKSNPPHWVVGMKQGSQKYVMVYDKEKGWLEDCDREVKMMMTSLISEQ